MRVPHTMLKEDTLRAVIEAFVAREGTDYGATERSMESKIADVLRQLENGQAFVTYDGESDSCSIVTKNAPRPTQMAAHDGYRQEGGRYDRQSRQRSYDDGSQETSYED